MLRRARRVLHRRRFPAAPTPAPAPEKLFVSGVILAVPREMVATIWWGITLSQDWGLYRARCE